LNSSAQITFYGLNYPITPWLLKNGIRCDNDSNLCNITSYDNITGTLVADVSGFSNYTTSLIPEIVSITVPAAQDPTECSLTNITATTINVSDMYGYAYIDLANSYVNFTNGATTRQLLLA